MTENDSKLVQFIVVDEATGQIKQNGIVPEHWLDKQGGEGLLVLRSSGESYNTHYVDLSGDEPVIVPMPEKPGDYYTFDYVDKAWIYQLDTEATAIRAKRDALLASSDWTQLPDVPEATRSIWAPYRQALRDITDQPGFPFDVTWPEAPNK